MMRNRRVTLLTGALLGAVLLGAWTPTVTAEAAATPTTAGVAVAASIDRAPAIGALPNAAAATAVLDAAEVEGLLYMREEEKLAHDVYTAFYEQWGLSIFQNIAASEQRHTDTVQTLLDRYGLTDPTLGHGVGEFSDPELQALYDELVQQGATSLEDALRVGAAVEEIDLLDLQAHSAATACADLERVYENLSAGSSSHLRAFVSTLESQVSVTYAPQYLSEAAYDEIISASGRGAGNAAGRGLGDSVGGAGNAAGGAGSAVGGGQGSAPRGRGRR